MSDESILKWAGLPWIGGTAQGCASAHLDLESLVDALEAIEAPSIGFGAVYGVVCRQPEKGRTTPRRVHFCPQRGVVGDRWALGKAQPEMQVAIMRADVAHLIANGQHGALFGDNLLVDLDLSPAHVPPGTQVQVGTAICVVSEEPHTACSQFAQRFGTDALKLTVDKRWAHMNIRGIYLTIVQAGDVAVGDSIVVGDPK